MELTLASLAQRALDPASWPVEPRRAYRIGLLALAMYFLAGTAMRLVEERLRPLEPAPAPAQSARDGAEPRRSAPVDAGAIARRNLFGPAAMGGSAAAARSDAPPKAKADLGLELMGTMVGEAGSAAVINDQQQRKQAIYRPGQTVRPGLSVVEVRRFGVILSSPEGEALLSMEEKNRPAGGAAAPERAAERLQEKAGRGEGEAQMARLERGAVEQALANLPQVMNDVRISPVTYEDSTAFRVENIRPGSIFTSLGLRNGDILYGVNGEMLQSQDQLMKLLTSGQETAVVNLVRGGRKQDVSVTVEGSSPTQGPLRQR